MRAKALIAAAVMLLALSGCQTDAPEDDAAPSPSPTAADTEVHWVYEGEAGPARWGELSDEYATCSEGKKQSPIDVVDVAPDGDKLGFTYEASSGTVINTGHTIQVKPEDGGSITVNGDRYDLAQFHFHSPSEHKPEGATHALEMHLVHEGEDGALAVVGVFIKEGDRNESFDGFWDDLPAEADEEANLPSPVDATDLLPDARNAVYLYDGSLTTPPCTEGVQWILLPATVEMSQEQIEAFRDVYDANARPLQPLNDRDVTEADLAR